MPELTLDSSTYPVTALALLRLPGPIRSILLAGEGPLLRVYVHESRQLQCTERVFDSQAIHGIVPLTHEPSGEGGNCFRHYVLVWGGRWVRLLEVCEDVGDSHSNGSEAVDDSPGNSPQESSESSSGVFQSQVEPLVTVKRLSSQIEAADWIYDACFRPSTADVEYPSAVLVTASNDLLLLPTSPCLEPQSRKSPPDLEQDKSLSLRHISRGPLTTLFSAHLLRLDADRVLVAAGTAFGEIFVWSCFVDSALNECDDSSRVSLHYVFTGHEGSIFGVRISEEMNSSWEKTPRRFLTSCSDDRTIRLWDISDLSHGTRASERSTLEKSLAIARGHSSRIWGLRFFRHLDSQISVLSYGEDGTAQVWLLQHASDLSESGFSDDKGLSSKFTLKHYATSGFHCGKNIWAAVVAYSAPLDASIITGGADGRIVSFDPDQIASKESANVYCRQWTMGDVSLQLEKRRSAFPEPAAKDQLKGLFKDLQGIWKLERELESSHPSFPSGNFEGSATFEPRDPTGDTHTGEYLYIEEGDFVNAQGLTLKASRCYAYRIDERAKIMSVWFVKPKDNETVDYLFHNMEFQKMPERRLHNGFIIADGFHLCVDDNYHVQYKFFIDKMKLTSWSMETTVKGPRKSYIARSSYFRSTELTEKRQRSLQAHSSKSDSFKAYVWLSDYTFLCTTALGQVVRAELAPEEHVFPCAPFPDALTWRMRWRYIDSTEELKTNSAALHVKELNMTLLAGVNGLRFIFQQRGGKAFRLAELFAIQSNVALVDKVGFRDISFSTLILADEARRKKGMRRALLFVARLDSPIASIVEFYIYEGHTILYFPLQFGIEIPRGFVVTSCGLCHDLLILGSRHGLLAIFALDWDQLESRLLLLRAAAHGNDAVTVIKTFGDFDPSNTGHDRILTAGRDGRFAVHRIDMVFEENEQTRIELHLEHESDTPIGKDVESATFTGAGDLVLWGFRSKHFVVWNESKKREVLNVECGGAHRNWAYSYNPGSPESMFVWTKASICNLFVQRKPSHEVYQYGGHGREIKAMALSPYVQYQDATTTQYLATGAEDTTIRISTCDPIGPKSQGNKCLTIIRKHTAGIQQLRWSADGHYLFSAAGREEFFAWRVRSIPFFEIGVVCEAKCPIITDSFDLRIVDFAILDTDSLPDNVYVFSLVYSDSSLRIWSYETGSQEFKLLSVGSYSTRPHLVDNLMENCSQTLLDYSTGPQLTRNQMRNCAQTSRNTSDLAELGPRCLTQVASLKLGKKTLLCTARTDGFLAWWLVDPHDIGRGDSPKSSCPSLSSYARHRVHQNAILALLVIHLPDDKALYVTGGDDGALGLTMFTLSPFNARTLLIPRAHAAAVTALQCFFGSPRYDSQMKGASQICKIASASTDQRLKAWEINIDLQKSGIKGIRLSEIGKVASSVADMATMAVWEGELKGRNEIGFIVAGVGMEKWRLGEDELLGA